MIGVLLLKSDGKLSDPFLKENFDLVLKDMFDAVEALPQKVEALPHNELLVVLNLWVKNIIIASNTEDLGHIKTRFIDRLGVSFKEFEIYQKRLNERDTFIKERIIGKKFWMKEFDGLRSCMKLLEYILLVRGSLEKTPLVGETSTRIEKLKSDIKSDQNIHRMQKEVEIIDFLEEADNVMKPLNKKNQEELRRML